MVKRTDSIWMEFSDVVDTHLVPIVFIIVDYILHNWNQVITELRGWQELGVAIEQAQTA